MADTKLSDLPEIASLDQDDLIYVTDGMSKRIRKDNFEATIKPDNAGHADNADKLGGIDAADHYLRDGSRAMTADVRVGGYKVSGMTAGTDQDDAVNLTQLEQQVPLNGSRVMTGSLTIGDGDTGFAAYIRGTDTNEPRVRLKKQDGTNLGGIRGVETENALVLDRFNLAGDTIEATLALKENGELRYNGNEVMDESKFVTTSTGTPDAGKPIFLNGQGHIDPSMLDIGVFHYVGEFTPAAGSEYPDTTGESDGAFWVVEGLSSPYTFTGGDLSGRTIENGHFMVWSGGSWSIIVSSLDPTIYYKLDGTQSLTGNFAGGGFQLKNIADGTANDDAATYGQLVSASGSGQEYFLGVPIPKVVEKYPFKMATTSKGSFPRPTLFSISVSEQDTNDLNNCLLDETDNTTNSKLHINWSTTVITTIVPTDVDASCTFLGGGIYWDTSRSSITENKDRIYFIAFQPAVRLFVAYYDFETSAVVNVTDIDISLTFDEADGTTVKFRENFDTTFTIFIEGGGITNHSSFVVELDSNLNYSSYHEVSYFHSASCYTKISDKYKYIGGCSSDQYKTLISFGDLEMYVFVAVERSNILAPVLNNGSSGQVYDVYIYGDYILFRNIVGNLTPQVWYKDEGIEFFNSVYDIVNRQLHDYS